MGKFFLSVILTFSIFGQEDRSIISLEGDSCWIKNISSDVYKAAFFKNNKAQTFELPRLDQVDGPVKLVSAKFYLYCSSLGGFFVASAVTEENDKVCVHFKNDKVLFYSNNESKEGFCYGQLPGKLIITMSDVAKDHLRDSDLVKSVVKIYSDTYEVILKDQLKFKESNFKSFLMNESPIKNEIKKIEYDNLILPSGTSHEL